MQCPLGCSGEDHSPKETGFPVFKERESAVQIGILLSFNE